MKQEAGAPLNNPAPPAPLRRLVWICENVFTEQQPSQAAANFSAFPLC